LRRYLGHQHATCRGAGLPGHRLWPDRHLRGNPYFPAQILMRILAVAILAIGTLSAAAPARAQTYDPNYPVCLHVYGDPTYYECRYTTLTQCGQSASGRAAECVVNPYFENAAGPVGPRHRHRRVY
jgi:hypothetical protein